MRSTTPRMAGNPRARDADDLAVERLRKRKLRIKNMIATLESGLTDVVIPAQAGIQTSPGAGKWIPAFAGMTNAWEMIATLESRLIPDLDA